MFSAALGILSYSLFLRHPATPAQNVPALQAPLVKARFTSLPPLSPSPPKSLGELCAGADTENFDCYENYYARLVKKKGIAAAMVDIKRNYKVNPYVISQCHPLMHVIGREASEQFQSPGDAFVKGDAFCWSGYYHGVMEGIVSRIGPKNVDDKLNGICANIKGKDVYSFDYYNCVHGLGHGLMDVNQDELFQSLDNCDKLTGYWEQSSCASGVFMENVIIDNKNHKTNYLKPDDPLYPCPEVPEKYKQPCYLMQSSYILKVVGGDFAKTFVWCEKAEVNYQNTCYESVGRDASGRSASDVTSTRNNCLLGKPGDEQEHCVIGAVKDFISYFHSDKQAKELCNSFAAENLRSTCLYTADWYYKTF